jgi:acetylornithine/succinyldiaminopimelate/putrescine aminotransferase/predicted amino acid dehydrogenase
MIKDKLFEFFGIGQIMRQAAAGELELSGQSALDFLSQYGASPFGGTHPGLADQAASFLRSGQPALCQPMQAEFAALLKEKLLALCGEPAGQVILSQGGAETVEIAVKLARAATGRAHTIALQGGFHGKTMAAVQLTANADYSDYFGIPNSFVRRLCPGSVEQLRVDFADLTRDGDVNAVIVEVIQGESGMLELAPEWLLALQDLCRKAEVLFCVDEIQTGLGRTGVMLAARDMGLRPDITLLSKALGGGIVPIGACVVADGVMPPDFTVFHSGTFANNNFTSFVALKALELIEETLPRVDEIAAYLDRALTDLAAQYDDVFSHVSGRGLMRGLHLRVSHDTDSLVANFQWESGVRSYAISAWLLRQQQLLTMPCFSKPSCLRLQPPLTVTRDQIDRAICSLAAVARVLRSPYAESELIGERHSPFDIGAAKRRAKQVTSKPKQMPDRLFQFNMHPLHDWSFLNSLPEDRDETADASAKYLERHHQLGQLFSGFATPCLEINDLKLGGRSLRGQLFGINLTAAQMLHLSARQRKSLQGIMEKSAVTYGADVMGLGAFTSIIASPGFRRMSNGASVTAGSSLTAFAAVQAALRTPEMTGPQRFGVVGANGSVGGLCVQMLLLAALKGHHVDSVVLFSNPENPQAQLSLAKSIRRWAQAWSRVDPITTDDPAAWRRLVEIARLLREPAGSVTNVAVLPEKLQRIVSAVFGRPFFQFTKSDDLTALASVDRLLLATNSTNELEGLNACKSDAILFDIGMPSSVSAAWISSAPCTVHTAGIVKGPEAYKFGHGNIVGLPPGMMLGCFAETITLAATNPAAAPIGPATSLFEAESIGQLALSVGLEPTVTSAMDCALATMPKAPEQLSMAG